MCGSVRGGAVVATCEKRWRWVPEEDPSLVFLARRKRKEFLASRLRRVCVLRKKALVGKGLSVVRVTKDRTKCWFDAFAAAHTRPSSCCCSSTVCNLQVRHVSAGAGDVDRKEEEEDP